MRLEAEMHALTALSASLGRIFTRRLLAALLAISVASNSILLLRLTRPTALRDFALSFREPEPPGSGDHIRGPAAALTVIEYGDFQCPFCAGMHETMRQLSDQGQVRWVFRHYPLTEIHPRGAEAAEASECATEQGSFWPFADSLYARQQTLDTLDFGRLAAELGLDRQRFEDCRDSRRSAERVLRDVRSGDGLRVQATPTFFVNGKRYEGFRSALDLRRQLGL